METINDRMKELRKNLNLSQEAFGETINLQRNTISLMENNKMNLSDRTISDICREFNVSEMWLREGLEPIYRPVIGLDNEMMMLATDLIDTDDEFSKIVISQYLRLSPEGKVVVKDLILSIAKQYSDIKKDDSVNESS